MSVEQLIDTVWGDEPPDTARALLQVHISRLRKALGTEGLPTVGHSASGGYVLDAAPGTVDLFRFRALVDEAQHVNGVAAEELYQRAMALWQGEPLSGGSGERLAQRVVPALLEERLRATEGSLATRLSTRGPADVLAALRRLNAEHPDRERVAVLLMRALQQAGRRSDALTVYRTLRRHLADAHGIEPTTATQAVHAEILHGDDATSSTGPFRPLVTVPAQLPPGLDDLAGRESEAALLRSVIRGPSIATPRLAVLSGPPGYGKSTLAVHTAHRHRADFPDGQLFADLGGACDQPANASVVLAGFLRALGLPTRQIDSLSTEERTAQLRSLLADRQVLMVLDDAKDTAQVRPLLPAGPGCAVLITSRATLTGLESSTLVDLPELSRNAGLEILARAANRKRLQADPAATEQILDACAGVPLAIQIAASRLAARPQWSAHNLAAVLRDERSVLDELVVDDLAVRSSIGMSYRRLDSAHARAFRLLSLAGHDLAVPHAVALIGLDDRPARPLLDRLIDMHLLTSAAANRIGMHDLVRVFAREQLDRDDSTEERVAAVRRLLGSMCADLFPAIELISPGLDLELPHFAAQFAGRSFASRVESAEWLEREFRDISHALTLAAHTDGVPAQALSQVLRALAHFADSHGHTVELEGVARAVITSSAEHRDRIAHGVALTVLGGALMRRKGHSAGSTTYERRPGCWPAPANGRRQPHATTSRSPATGSGWRRNALPLCSAVRRCMTRSPIAVAQ